MSSHFLMLLVISDSVKALESSNSRVTSHAMEAILSELLEPDSERIKAANIQLRAAFKQPGVIPQLCNILR